MRAETKVGILFLVTLMGVIVFAFLLGLFNPFTSRQLLHVMYNFAGGIEVGSPVRVMGIKVGKVTQIDFMPDYKTPSGEEVKLRVTIGLDKSAWPTIRKDSKYYINMAGVIGETFLEISPGSYNEPQISPGDYVRGEDPPRVDQLISQSYGLAGKMIELLEKNEGTVVNVISQIDSLLNNFNKTLNQLDKVTNNKEVSRLLDNSIRITDDVAYFTGQLRTKKAEETFNLIHRLIFRLEDLDAKSIKKFFQEEGIKARLF
jgi:phospholipid/cholesterol/gamma-HCH transport system substrate-binding protein